MPEFPERLENFWKSEEEFTSWLSGQGSRDDIESDPIDELERAIGLTLFDIEHQAELDGGDFIPDIVAKGYDGDSTKIVLIEAQHRDSQAEDQRHFGKLLLYADASDADWIVWVVPGNVYNRYYSTMNWVSSLASVEFQVIQMEMLVNRTVRLNADRKYPIDARDSIPESETAQRQRRFWAGFRSSISEEGLLVNGFKPKGQATYPQGGNLTEGKGLTITFGMPANRTYAYCRLDIEGEDVDEVFSILTHREGEVASSVGVPVDDWVQERTSENKAKLEARRDGFELSDHDCWSDSYDWFKKIGEEMANLANRACTGISN